MNYLPKISETIIAAHRFNINHVAFTSKIASCREINLKRFHGLLGRIVVVGYCRAGHFDVITTEEKKQSIAAETDDIRHENKLHCALWFQLEALKKATANENANAGTGYGDRSGKNARLALAQTELCFEIFR